jgi:hypothetical protein
MGSASDEQCSGQCGAAQSAARAELEPCSWRFWKNPLIGKDASAQLGGSAQALGSTAKEFFHAALFRCDQAARGALPKMGFDTMLLGGGQLLIRQRGDEFLCLFAGHLPEILWVAGLT